MLEDTISDLKELLQNVKYTEGFVKRLEKAYNEALNALAILQDEAMEFMQGRKISNEFINNNILNTCLSATMDKAPQILTREVKDAARSTEEFSKSILLDPLVEAASYPDNFDFTVNKRGWSSSISVEIDFNRSAGSLEQWAQAVNYVRESIIQSKNDSNPEKASAYWATYIYARNQQNKYVITIKDRFAASGALAPYWELLDKGNEEITMSSDWGGYPYPVNRGTNFTGKAETKIKQFFKTELAAQMEYYTAKAEEIYKDMVKLSDYITQAEEIINEINNTKLEQMRAKERRADSIASRASVRRTKDKATANIKAVKEKAKKGKVARIVKKRG